MRNRTLLRGLLAIIVVFACVTGVLAQKSLQRHMSVKDTLLVSKSDMHVNDSMQQHYFSIMENGNGTYSMFRRYGLKNNLYQCRYDSTMIMIDSVRIENYDSLSSRSTGIVDAIKITNGFLLLTSLGVYQYNQYNHVVWNVNSGTDMTFFESIYPAGAGYVIVGSKIAQWPNGGNDTLFKFVKFINLNGTLRWQKTYTMYVDTSAVGLSSTMYYDHSIIYHNNGIYFAMMDTIEYRSMLGITSWQPSNYLVKLDTFGNEKWKKHLDISVGEFMKNKKGVFFVGNILAQGVNRLYRVDTANGTVVFYYPYVGYVKVYNDSMFLRIDMWSAMNTTNDIHIVFDIVYVNDTTSSSIPHGFSFIKTFTDSSEVGFFYDFVVDSKGAVLSVLPTYKQNFSPWYSWLNTISPYRFVFRTDSIYYITDSLWNVDANVTPLTYDVAVSWNTLLRGDGKIWVWSVNDSTNIHSYTSSIDTTLHAISFVVSDTGWYAYYVQTIDELGDTLISGIYNFYVGPKPKVFVQGSNSQQIKLSVYPNPSSGTFTVSSGFSGKFVLYDATGKSVLTETVNGTKQIDASSLSSGEYTYRFIYSWTIVTGKLIIKK